MGSITVLNHLSLDGVMQGPASPDEDPRDGFTLGGWTAPGVDDVMVDRLGAMMAADDGALLLGRRTFEQFAAYWPHQTGNPYTEVLNRRTKYVVSTTLAGPPSWENSVLLRDVDAVADVRASEEGPLTVMGSGVLVASLRERDLVDRYVLMVHPVLLGSGRRLFDGGPGPADLALVDCVTTSTGVIIASYERRS
jgi:dihydrofolate reductase